MSLALQISSEPFGGKNMIFAGDFAQLPPPGRSPSLYSQTIGSVLHTTHSHNIQKWTIGKSLWHQVTVVVILHQNMCQKLQTAGDAKFRKATECCVTNGAEAIVVGWNSQMITTDKQVLDTLFVRLNNPPTNIQLDDLPLNVVPISRHTISVKCDLPNDNILTVSRDQVPVIPNFAMTDFASQGRTRANNVVDLHNCCSHQSVYTCLSRSASIDGTILVQGFDASKVQGGLSGYLRQEFRELELLDDVTKLKYEEKLPIDITGSTRTSIIRKFQEWKGSDYVPKHVHHSIKWSSKAPMTKIEDVPSTPWIIIQTEKKEKRKRNTTLVDHHVNDNILSNVNPSLYVSAHGTNILHTTSNDTGQVKHTNGIKRQKLTHVSDNNDNISIGMKWSNITLSCAYDCLFTILRNVYIHNDTLWIENVINTNRFINMLTNGWKTEGHVHEVTHDKIHNILHNSDPETFTIGNGTDLFALCKKVLQYNSFVLKQNYICSQCERVLQSDEQMYAWWYVNSNKKTQVSRILKNEWTSKVQDRIQCPSCHGQVVMTTQFNNYDPPLIGISIGNANVQITASLAIQFDELNHNVKYRLCGIIYHGSFC